MKSLAAYFRKILQPVDRRLTGPSPHFLCWYCSKQLPAVFTTVNGHRVHSGCRHGAALVLAIREKGAVVQANPDFQRDWPRDANGSPINYEDDLPIG